MWQEKYCWYTKDECLLQNKEQILFQEVRIVSQEKILTLSHRKYISWEKILPVTGNFLLWQDIASCDRKCFPVTGNFVLLWEQTSSYVRKFLPVTEIFFLWQEISSKDRKFLPEAQKLLHTISFWGRNIILVAGTFFHLRLKDWVKITHLFVILRENHAHLSQF